MEISKLPIGQLCQSDKRYSVVFDLYTMLGMLRVVTVNLTQRHLPLSFLYVFESNLLTNTRQTGLIKCSQFNLKSFFKCMLFFFFIQPTVAYP